MNIKNERVCIERGYMGTVTMMGLPTPLCYIDNRPNSIDNYKIEYPAIK
jgi:hypothetical protein